MGAALSSRAEWISASETKAKLDFSRSNESLLNDIVYHIEELVKQSPKEADVIFKTPFIWQSSLESSAFDNLQQPDFVRRLYNHS